MNDIAISVKNLTKKYRIFGHPGDRIKQALTLGRVRFHREFTALQGVSFEIKKGETVGIIGRNGSGKSTLLQLICGILKPTTGTVQVNGRVSALLELGAGFNPEFTGRENAYFQGAVIGLTKEEMDERFEDIAAFADIGEFIDQPVRTYSSGMFVRLAFSVATAVQPDVLVVDEALSVGDVAFQANCFARIRALNEEGTTLLFVTHSMDDVVRHCTRALLLDKGEMVADGDSREITNLFLSRTIRNHSAATPESQAVPIPDDHLALRPYYRKEEHRWGMGGAWILDCDIQVEGESYAGSLPSNTNITLTLKIAFHVDVLHPVYGLVVKTIEGLFLYSTNSLMAAPGVKNRPARAGDIVRCTFTLPLPLNAGSYLLSVGVSADQGREELIPLDRRYDVALITITSDKSFWGLVDLDAHFTYEEC